MISTESVEQFVSGTLPEDHPDFQLLLDDLLQNGESSAAEEYSRELAIRSKIAQGRMEPNQIAMSKQRESSYSNSSRLSGWQIGFTAVVVFLCCSFVWINNSRARTAKSVIEQIKELNNEQRLILDRAYEGGIGNWQEEDQK